MPQPPRPRDHRSHGRPASTRRCPPGKGAIALLALALLASGACSGGEASADAGRSPPGSSSKSPMGQPVPVAPKVDHNPEGAVQAVVGKAAPQFMLPDLDGNRISLQSFAGRIVVLEWFNPKCPFVVASHTRGSLVDAARRHSEDGVAWLAINSGAAGKQGHAVAENREAKADWGMEHPILRDEAGTVGKTWGATNTPHMFVINEAGVVVYAGAIDNSPDGEGGSPTGGALVRHVDEAIAALRAGKPVPVAQTKAYGCSVKYGP